MKICIVGPCFPFRGGIAHYTSLLFKELSKDHDVVLINFSRQYPEFLFPGKTQKDFSNSKFQVKSQQIIDSINPISWIRAFRYIKRQKPDLVIYQWWQVFFAPSYHALSFGLRFFCNCKQVFTCHNVLPHENSFLDKILLKIAFVHVKYFLVHSQEDYDNLLKIKPHATVAKNPHPTYEVFSDLSKLTKTEARKALKIDDNCRLILFFGYVREYKGIRYLLEAMPKILEKMDVKLMIVGEWYEKKEDYQLWIDEVLAKNSLILVEDYVPNEEVGKYFSAADVVVMPYVSATQSGIAQIAYGFDKPVITTNVGGLPEVVLDNETGYLVPPKDSNAIANTVIKFYEENKQLTFIENIKKHKKGFSWKYLVQAMEKLISQ